MNPATKEEIIAALKFVRESYATGRWMEIPPRDDIDRGDAKSLRIFLWLVAAICLSGIVATLILASTNILPQATAAWLPFILGAILYAVLARLGVSVGAIRDAVDLSSKASGSMSKADAGKGP